MNLASRSGRSKMPVLPVVSFSSLLSMSSAIVCRPSLFIHLQLGHAHLSSLLAAPVGFVAECTHVAD